MGLRYAIIGCGRISPNHIAAALENELDIVALCDIDLSRMEKIVREFNLPASTGLYGQYKEMIDAERLDLVAVCTESGKHGSIALDCLDAGLNLIIEKPIALSLTDADRIISKAEEKGLKVSACHQNRFNKAVRRIREAIDLGRFGKLLHGTAHIRWNRNENYYRQAPWRGTWADDGGALMNQCIHNIDLLRWMMGGEIEEVIGITDNLMHRYIEAEDFGMALVRFTNGSYGIIEGTTNVFPVNLEETLYIFGESGTVKAGGKSVNLIEEWQFADKSDDLGEVQAECNETPPNVYGFGHTPLYADVIDAIISDRAPYVSAKDGRDALELVLAVYESSLHRKSVKLPMAVGSTLDSKGRFVK